VSSDIGTNATKIRFLPAQWEKPKVMRMKNILMASALVLGVATAASAQGQTPVPTPDNRGGTIQQQEMKRNNNSSAIGAPTAKTTGSGAVAKDPANSTASDPQKKSMDDPKAYGKPDKH
jgi:hypothetical protein